jgi:hypothetical protein
METMVLDRGRSSYLVNAARLVRSADDVSAELAAVNGWPTGKSSPFIQWIAGDFVEGDKPNSNTQFWTAGDLELAEYTIKYTPLNMVHRFRTPIGFFAETNVVKLQRALKVAPEGDDTNAAKEQAAGTGSMKIQALSGLWTHIFPFEAAQVEAADAEGLLYFSMECRGTHLVCAGENGCGEKFDYMATASHCEHLQERSSIRHIVNPTFRGGALIVPPVRPGWKHAHASVVSDVVMQEAAAFAEQNESQYTALVAGGVDLTASGWEQLMGLVMQAHSVSGG